MTTSDRDFQARYEQLGRFFVGTSDVHVAMDRVVGKLDELQVPYVICGGMAINAHGHQRATTDVDLILTATGLEEFKAKALGLGWVEKFPGSRGMRDAECNVPIDVLIAGGYPGDGTPRGVVFPDPGEAIFEVAGKRYLSLSKLLELKLASGMSAPERMQDHADVIALIKANDLDESFGQELHRYVRAKYAELWGYAQKPPSQPE